MTKFGGALAWVGERLLIGTCQDDAGGENSGAAYLFDLAAGAAKVRFTSTQAGEQAGWSVAARGPMPSSGAAERSGGTSRVWPVLVFEGPELADLSPLSDLDRLRWLSLSGNQIEDVVPAGRYDRDWSISTCTTTASAKSRRSAGKRILDNGRLPDRRITSRAIRLSRGGHLRRA